MKLKHLPLEYPAKVDVAAENAVAKLEYVVAKMTTGDASPFMPFLTQIMSSTNSNVKVDVAKKAGAYAYS